MCFVFESICRVYERYATIDTMSKIMAVVAPLLIAREELAGYLRSFIPSYVERIVHFDVDDGKISEKYLARKNMYSLKNGTYELMGLPRDGYYMFVVWNNLRLCYEHHVLKADLVEKALETKNVQNMWAFHDHGIVMMLSNFVAYSNIGASRILGITLNREDATKKLKPFMKSISIQNNVCPKLLYMLTRYLDNGAISMIALRNSCCIYMNDDMDEVLVGQANEYLVKPSSDICSHCLDDEDEDENDKGASNGCDEQIEELFEDPQDESEKDKDV